jgi:hypothetical protein
MIHNYDYAITQKAESPRMDVYQEVSLHASRKSLVKVEIWRKSESPIRIPQTPSAFHLHAQRNAFHHRDVRQQSRSFGPENQWLRRTPSSNQLCWD